MQGNPHDRLFPELKWHRNGGYSKYARAWFNKVLDKECGVTFEPGTGFNALRAAVVSHLRNAATPNEKEIAAIFGHVDRTADTNHNAAPYKLSVLQSLIQALNFGGTLLHVNPYHASNFKPA